MNAPSPITAPPSAQPPRWQAWGCLALLLVGLQLVLGPKIMLSGWHVDRRGNAALDEALQWKKGALTLSDEGPTYEIAEADGRRYNVVGLGFVLLSLVGTTLTQWIGGPADSFYAPCYAALVALPLPLAGFWAFHKIVKSPTWAAVLTACLITGTSLAPVLTVCGSGSIYYINHALAVTGLLIFAADLLGDRRIWPAVIGLCLAAWSRQMTCLYALPLLWITWRDVQAGAAHGRAMTPAHVPPDDARQPPGVEQTPSRSRRGQRRPLWIALAGVGILAAVPMTLNTLKFGSPFDAGYRRMYEHRGLSPADPIGRKARACFFGPRYIPEHLRAMNLAFPRWDIRAGTLYADIADTNGASIWLTSPLLLGVVMAARRWWRVPQYRVLMLSTLPVIAGLMCYHTTGADDSGYYRYSLDFIPIWLMVIAPYTQGRRGIPMTLACLAYSALYFNLLS